MAVRVGIVGASGYAGAVLARLVSCHPEAKLAFLTSDRHEGRSVRDELGGCFEPSFTFAPNAAAAELSSRADVVFLATSADVSAVLAPIVSKRATLTIDLSGAFRLRNADAYRQWYGFEHPAPASLETAFYGLPELFGAPPEGVSLVANPGCYATATLLALAPLLSRELCFGEGLIVDAKSGFSGAGRRAQEEYSFVESQGDLRAYRVLSHQHVPEVELSLLRKCGVCVTNLAFVPHLIPISRGILVTTYAHLRPGVTAAAVQDALMESYGSSAFVRVKTAEEVRIHGVAGTNFAHVGAVVKGSLAVVICAIDNLLKGAAGQAVQNMNLFLGLVEEIGLSNLSRFAP